MESEDPDVVAATMEAPGVVLKRPVGSSGSFKENADLPTNLVGEGREKKTGGRTATGKQQKRLKRALDPAVDHKAALAFEREQRRRERERVKEDAAHQKNPVLMVGCIYRPLGLSEPDYKLTHRPRDKD